MKPSHGNQTKHIQYLQKSTELGERNQRWSKEIKGYPACTDGYPACTDGYPACIDRYPACTDGYPACTDRYPACTVPNIVEMSVLPNLMCRFNLPSSKSLHTV